MTTSNKPHATGRVAHADVTKRVGVEAIEEMRLHRDAHHLPAPRGTNAASPIIYTPQDSSRHNTGK